MTLLDTVGCPADLRALPPARLGELADDIRRFLVDRVARTGGHLGPNLGAVELTIALHRVFDSPREPLVWDTGHQAYVHKLLTGRRDEFGRLRKRGGISGYPSREESPHDLVENSHASTALSYADGLAKAIELSGDRRHVVAVIGDGALTGGMAWEALNNLGGAAHRPVVVVLNDNGRSYAPTVGGLATHLAALRAGAAAGGNLFEAFGLGYVGPVDGHDAGAVEAALRAAKATGRTVVVHCLTRKGRGYRPAEDNELDHCHAVGVIDADSGKPLRRSGRSWTSVFADELVDLGSRRPDIVAVTAAMLEPAGLAKFAQAFPERIFDVGIAEQHAVTSAAGLALGGLHPVVAIYSTFLNRALDQVLMDVALHRLGVTFVLDRSGVTGDDGASHNGMWDLSLFQAVPGLRICAPRDAATLLAGLRHAVTVDDGPTLVRFPKGEVGPDVPPVDRLGGVDVLRRDGGDALVVSVGALAPTCLQAADLLARDGLRVTVVDPVWVAPVDPALVTLAAGFDAVVTVEDSGRTSGAGAALGQALADAGVRVPVHNLGLPRRFLAHGSRAEVLAECGLTPDGVADAVRMAVAGADVVTIPGPAPRPASDMRLLESTAANYDS